MKTTATNKKIRQLLTEISDGSLILQPEFQRRLVWTHKHKQEFIRTVLEGLPFPEIFLCDGDVNLKTGQGNQQVVDGQQRLTTLHQYFTASMDLVLGSLAPYEDLEDDSKLAFLNYDVVVRDLGELTNAEVRDVFTRMNSTNYGLNAMEVNNARFDGALKRTAQEVSEWTFFDDHRVFNAVDIRRMNDIRWCLTLIITLASGYFSRDVEHEAYLEQYNDEFPESDDVKTKLEAVADLIENLGIVSTSRMWQKNDLFTLMVELSNLDPKKCNDAAGLGESLATFYAEVDGISEGAEPTVFKDEAEQYRVDVISGTNERARRIRRGDIIRDISAPYFESPAES
ncbi:DUF262 domain-containing protein [Streptomyces sp. SLBN-31]|uniref:DUF262 domain-containing protein n=1 Tax=Streptomyces sp. SLBN-31 TaxID=2768444 RepID=UPI0011548924|nr:DUF262 domain-containing protein [Streptomyces sp. SLBN-31]TQJ89996.1 uncharacterized protein DUF262 [Streptomyces sp. SLBN-31]